ncbi:MAG: VIT and VWA domain-containing protein [Firmicutes bacterium]|nr:VIT and VWA domain-containing protein [Bacillota bacterium]
MRRIKKWLCAIFAAVLCACAPAAARGAQQAGDSAGGADVTLAPYFFVESADASTDRFPLKDTEVVTRICGVIADTYVTQTYANEGENPISASYVFPASTKVSVHGMTMRIGDQVVTAKIEERGEAKQDFEQAKSDGKSASLLEEQRPNVFSMDVANIMPGDAVRIELHYTELIAPADGVYEFVFPTVVGPRYASPSDDQTADANQFVAGPYLADGDTPPGGYGISVSVTAGVPITGLECKSHKVDIEWDGEKAAKVALADPADYAGNRDFILDYRLTGQEIESGLMLNTGDGENFFMLMVQPPERVDPKEIPPREYIFVLDVSGSMYGYPLDAAKQLIHSLIGNLRTTDSFNLVLFSGASTLMSPESLPAAETNVLTALRLIDAQNGGGGTELAPAFETALAVPKNENASRSVIVITDGYIAGEQAIFDIIGKNLGNANFFSFGIGEGVNRYLIEGIAKAGLGESFVVPEQSEAPAAADRFLEYVRSPLLTDIKVTYNGFDAYEAEPPNIPTLFARRPVVIFGKWRGELTGSIEITGKSGNGVYSRVIAVSDATPSEDNKAIGLLWARSRVERLTDYGFSDEKDAAKKEVTDIGLKYSMMTPYTSFVAVLDEVRNPDKNSADVRQPLPLPLNVSNLAVGGVTTGSEPGIAVLVCGMPVMLAIGVLLRRKKRTGRRKQCRPLR